VVKLMLRLASSLVLRLASTYLSLTLFEVVYCLLLIIMPLPHRAEALTGDARLTSVCLSRTLGLS